MRKIQLFGCNMMISTYLPTIVPTHWTDTLVFK